MQSYNHPALQHTCPPRHVASLDVPGPSQFSPTPRPRFTSVSGPSPYMPQAAPYSLIAPTSSFTPSPQHARVRDKTVPQRPRTSHGPAASPHLSPQCPSFYGDYFSAQTRQRLPSPPPLPQKPQTLLKPLTNPLPSIPPIPPKPPALAIYPASRISLYPDSIPLSIVCPSSWSPQPITPEPLYSPNESEFELALTLSASEARRHEQELIAQEEELTRALEESRLTSSRIHTVNEQSSSSPPSLRPPSTDRASTSAIKASAHLPEGESWLHLITPAASTSSEHSSLKDDFLPSHSPVSQNAPDRDGSPRGALNNVQNQSVPRDTLSATPPLYANTVSNLVRKPFPAPSPTRSTVTPSSPSVTSTTHVQNDHTPSSDHASTSPSVSLTQSRRSSGSEQSPMPPFASRPSWTSALSENSTSTGHSLGNELLPVSSDHRPPTHPSASPSLSSTPSANLNPLDEGIEEEAEEAGPSTRPAFPLSANQYVEREMLMGISMGFTLPVISTVLLPMAGPMPNVITLPYGRAPVFHFQAPSWRTLLKLMARLSGTRVEPTLSAISTARHNLKLRTVIQFVKIHHSASEWRTVLYLTTDYPPPANLQNSHRYTNGDISVLPYSYMLSPLPTLLRDGPESPMAKYYVVPSTPTTPYPNLPINFPDLAMYLQSAVQDSRRHASDSSSGLRKLAQYIDGCYRMEERVAPIDQESVSKRKVGNMIKRVMGRNRVNRRGGGNEEIYDLVTPFVADEWG